MEPHDDNRGEAKGNSDHVQGAVYGMGVRTIVMRVQTHGTPHVSRSRCRARHYTSFSRAIYSTSCVTEINLPNTSFESSRPRGVSRITFPCRSKIGRASCRERV